MKKWDYILVHRTSNLKCLDLPDYLKLDEGVNLVKEKWSITVDTSEEMLASYPTAQKARLDDECAPLPLGWSAQDHSALDAATPPPDLEASLALRSHALGADKTREVPVLLKDWIRDFGQSRSGPVSMLNLLAYNPGKRSQFQQYIAAFAASVGIKHGGEAQLLGSNIHSWSSRHAEHELNVEEAKRSERGYDVEGGSVVGWEDVGLIWYPSIWHFAMLLDDPEYAEADRKFKIGTLRDGPILCCTEVEL